MSMVIVTQNQYIQCSKIIHIVMDEQINWHDVHLESGARRTVREKYYQITVVYHPIDITASGSNGFGTHQNSQDQRECSVIIRGAVNAHNVFKDIVEQIREQLPDQVYLDKALERMLKGISEEEVKLKDSYYGDAMIEEEQLQKTVNYGSNANVPSPKKVRRARKAKRAGKGVLRATKKRP